MRDVGLGTVLPCAGVLAAGVNVKPARTARCLVGYEGEATLRTSDSDIRTTTQPKASQNSPRRRSRLCLAVIVSEVVHNISDSKMLEGQPGGRQSTHQSSSKVACACPVSIRFAARRRRTRPAAAGSAAGGPALSPRCCTLALALELTTIAMVEPTQPTIDSADRSSCVGRG